MKYSHKHLVIGAGFVGLGMAKALKAYKIAYDQVEARDDLGGNWYHGVYPHVHIISSKRTTEYTDFHMPADYPDFPSAREVLAYLRSYAEHFGLRGHIEFNKCIEMVEPKDGLWSVRFTDGEERLYKGILVCNGHHWDPRHPELRGTFTGEYIHSKQYKNEAELAGKRVLVIGGGNSACDIAVDAARSAEAAHISWREGYWVLPKSLMGRPTVEYIRRWVPVWAQRLLLRTYLFLLYGNIEKFGLQKPNHKIFEKHPTLNDLLMYYIKHGRIKAHPAIEKVEGKQVTFTDGTSIEVDKIVAATGFHLSFPFLKEGLVPVKGASPQLPAGTYHPEYKGFYLVGWSQARYGVGPLITAGARFLCENIILQDQLQVPIGKLLKRLGVRPPRTHIVDPMKMLRSTEKARKRMRYLPKLEKKYFPQGTR